MAIDIDNLTYLARIDPVVLKDILTELDERIIKLECENKEILSKIKELQNATDTLQREPKVAVYEDNLPDDYEVN